MILVASFYSVSYCGMIISTIIVTLSDPTDPTVKFERHLRSQLILNQDAVDAINTHAEFYCSVCEAHVVEGSKHCSFCNRCVYGFDHHCRWVSNDIGQLNYIQFIRMLLFTLSTLLIQIIQCSITLSKQGMLTDEFLSKDELLGLTYATLALTFLFLTLVLILFCFHVFLIQRNMTTLSFLRQRAKQKASKVVTRIKADPELEIDNGIGAKERRLYWKEIFGCCKEKHAPSAAEMLIEAHAKFANSLKLTEGKSIPMEGFSFDKDSVS